MPNANIFHALSSYDNAFFCGWFAKSVIAIAYSNQTNIITVVSWASAHVPHFKGSM